MKPDATKSKMKSEPKITVQSVNVSGVTFARGEGKEKETVEVAWNAVFELAGKSDGWGGPSYPHMMPKGPFADLAREAMKLARELKVRVLMVAAHPYNQVRVETVAGEYVGQEMGVDWAHTQHAFPAQAENEAAELSALYGKKKLQIIRK